MAPWLGAKVEPKELVSNHSLSATFKEFTDEQKLNNHIRKLEVICNFRSSRDGIENALDINKQNKGDN